MRSTRRRTCTDPAPKYGGVTCRGDPKQRRDRYMMPHCPVDGKWSQWGAWSPVTVTCGVPTVTRRRTCTSPRPQYDGKDCRGRSRAYEERDTGIKCPIHGAWSEWAPRTECPISRRRWLSRSCSNPAPKYNGRLCKGSAMKRETCNVTVVDGGWCPHGQWSLCSTVCYMDSEAEMFRTRTRKCECPKPKHSGQPCKGKGTEEGPCEFFVPCFPATRAPCKKTTTAPDYYNYNNYGNGGGDDDYGLETTPSTSDYGGYDNYDDGC